MEGIRRTWNRSGSHEREDNKVNRIENSIIYPPIRVMFSMASIMQVSMRESGRELPEFLEAGIWESKRGDEICKNFRKNRLHKSGTPKINIRDGTAREGA